MTRKSRLFFKCFENSKKTENTNQSHGGSSMTKYSQEKQWLKREYKKSIGICFEILAKKKSWNKDQNQTT